MSVLPRRALIGFFSLTAFATSGAAPPNDNFVDRIVLTGNSITFTGTLAEATTELPYEVSGWPIVIVFPYSSQSVWWEWTATTSTVVTLQIIDIAPRPRADGLVVYANPPAGFPTNCACGPSMAGLAFDPANPWPYFSFNATNGTTHYIQLCGNSSSTYRINLLADNNPIIIEQPKSHALNTNENTLLTVMAAGFRPLSYQWGFGGGFLAGETNVMLALDAVTTNMAGDYFVVVGNATGVTTSQLATVTVTANDRPPTLATDTLGLSNQFSFLLNAEAGRYYRIETSADLKLWSPEQIFPLGLYSPSHSNLTSLIFYSNAVTSLEVSANSTRKFVRASRYIPADVLCNRNLRQIRYAKHIWAWDNHKSSTDTPTDIDLYPVKSPQWRQNHLCPLGGVYRANSVDTPPTCSITNHVLEEPR